MERKVSRGLKHNGNKKQASNGQRTSGMEEDFIGNQGLEGNVAGVEKKKKKKKDVVTPLNWLVSYKFYEGTITDSSIEIKEVRVNIWESLSKDGACGMVGI